MDSFDFLSNSPKNYIFNKKSNKTNLGGFLFITYIIVIFSITFGYIYDFYIDYDTNNKYEIQSSIIEELVDFKKMIEKKDVSETNPVLNFSIELYDYYGNKLSDNFQILDSKTHKQIKRNTNITEKVSDFMIDIIYKCNDTNCALREEDNTHFNYWIRINYPGFYLDHQIDGIPLLKENGTFYGIYPFFFKNNIIRNLYWGIIKYNDETKGFTRLIDKYREINKIYFAGYIEKTDYYTLDDSFYGINKDDSKIKLLCSIKMENIQDKITEYKRVKKSFLDVLSKIFALLSSIYTGFASSFGFLYSKNYDNYKIVKNIISKQKGIKLNTKNNNDRKIKEIELSDAKNSSLMNPSSLSNFIINDVENDENLNNEKDMNFKSNNNIESNINIPNFKFWDFLLNNFYKKSIIKSEKHEFLSICNEIVYKYFSIDYLLYNQIKFENLYKDYKWNNPELNNIEKNELIIELTKHI